MNSSDSEKTSMSNTRFRPSRQFYVFLFSLVLAASFWLLNALNKTYVEVFDIAIKYTNLPKNKAFSPIPPNAIRVELTGDGYSLFQLSKQAEEDTVVIDLSTIKFTNVGSKRRASFATSSIIKNLKNQVNNGLVVSKISRDTITIQIENGTTKEKEIQPNFDITIAKGFTLLKPVYTIPNKIVVTGPVTAFSAKRPIETDLVMFENISATQKIKAPLVMDNKVLESDTRFVEIVAEIEPLTEGEIEIPIQISGIPEGKRVRLIPNTVKLRYTSGLSQFENVKPELFAVTVSYDEIVLKPSKVAVRVISVPSFVNVIHFIPERVDYLILDL